MIKLDQMLEIARVNLMTSQSIPLKVASFKLSVVFQGKPDPLSNCSIFNQTAESLHVECIEGFDGGLRQDFIMEVYDTQTRKLVSNVTSRSPVFIVGGLESGLGFDIGLYAANRKGKSDVVHLQAFTLKSAEKHTGN